MKRFVFWLVFLGAFSPGFAQTRDFLISGVPFYPFHFMDGDKPAGIFVDYADLIFKKLNLPYRVMITDAAGFDRVKEGKVDAVMSVGYAKDRESFMIYPEGFSNAAAPKNYVWISNYHFFVLKEREQAYAFTQLADLRAKDPVVGVIKGISYHQDFWDQKFRVVEFETNADHFKALKEKKVDLFLTDRTVGSAIIKRDGYKGQITALPQSVFRRYYTLVLSKAGNYPGKEDVLKRFFEEYDRLKVTSAAQDIFLKYTN